MSFDKSLFRQLPVSESHATALINTPVASPYPIAGANIPLLPIDDHLALFRFYRDTPDPLLKRVAFTALTLCNYRLVLRWAMHMGRGGVPFRELVSAGVEGLQHAIPLYNPDSGNRPSTYLTWWIRNKILLERKTSQHIIHVPRNIIEDEERIHRGKPIRGKSKSRQRWGEMMRVVGSLDKTIQFENGDEEPMIDAVPSPLPHPSLLFDEQELGHTLTTALAQLPETWSRAIIHYFELNGCEYLNLRQLGETMGTARGTQSYRIKQGLKQLRGMPELQAFWGTP